MKIFEFFFLKGHITERGSDALSIIGIAITWGCAYFFDEWEGFWFWFLISIGVVVAYVGIYGSQAKKFGFQAPFTSDPLGWRKAKQSYKEEAAPEEDSEKKTKT